MYLSQRFKNHNENDNKIIFRKILTKTNNKTRLRAHNINYSTHESTLSHINPKVTCTTCIDCFLLNS